MPQTLKRSCKKCGEDLFLSNFDLICSKKGASHHKDRVVWNELPPERKQCRLCELPVETEQTTYSYWVAVEFACHAACKEKNDKIDAYICQKIDADCNDCIFFKRGKMTAPSVFGGHCTKFNKPTKAYPKQATCRPCFAHRKGKDYLKTLE